MPRCSRFLEPLAAALLAIGLAACATKSGTVVLLPQADGSDAAITVASGDRTLVLDRPYAAADLRSTGPRAYASSADDVRKGFGAALAAQPERPFTFTVFFLEDSDSLTEESTRMLDTIVQRIARYVVPDVAVIGHTDLVGSDDFNDALALRRAAAVRTLLGDRGIALDKIAVSGRGKREPAIPTRDGVAEPRNRRVEIVVR